MAVVPMRKNKAKEDGGAVALPATVYEPTPAEASAVAAYMKRRDSRRPNPKMKVAMSTRENGARVASIVVEHPDIDTGYNLISEAIAADSNTFTLGTIDALAKAAQLGGDLDEGQLNYALSMVYGLKPKDQIEATLAVQMAAIHLATMNTAAGLGGSKTHEMREVHERALNRLSRTFVAQVEALKRYRSKGEQRVYVERVNVQKGAQAIVGNVGGRGGEQDENGR
ncbi:hypothetical protein EN780_03050 [Mesorhizobium sp. M4B.F.Ca.ET.089.01.1.1]|uniref:hypothetical protein n=1 Tax=Mesorhizobium sp. M4B.F.Ca.ET.089.01.1.1 TaxID=2496662 RepID=UPI000FE2BB5F|nr:hypothetical protein [Mesorhizobium sp. M4B.F.Ca.ET.089.01.1.1]RWX70514.1 hypothetical protein EN780_03050 [Mesorhizobium sp. M4B.F.Ca.ET.089.01.1.1]